MNKKISNKNFIIPLIGIYVGGVCIGGNAVANCLFNQDFNFPLWSMGMFLLGISTMILCKNEIKETVA